MPKNASAASTAALTVFRLAALSTFLAVAMGAVVCHRVRGFLPLHVSDLW